MDYPASYKECEKRLSGEIHRWGAFWRFWLIVVAFVWLNRTRSVPILFLCMLSAKIQTVPFDLSAD